MLGYTRAEKRAVTEKTRENRKAWTKDNEKRKKEKKPTRTLTQYIRDTNLPTPPPSVEQSQRSGGKPKMFDPREPQLDRLPNVKISHAKTDEEIKRVQNSREQMAKLRGYPMSSSSGTTAVAGIKRGADDQNEHAPKRLKVERGPTVGVKRKAEELDSVTAKKFKAETRRAIPAVSKQKTDQHNDESPKPLKALPASLSAKHADRKDWVAGKSTKAKAAVVSLAAYTKRKTKEQQIFANQKCKASPVASDTSVDDEVNDAATSSTNPQNDSCSISHATVEQIDSAKKQEKDSEPDAAGKPVQEPSSAASGKAELPKADGEDGPVESVLGRNPATVDLDAAYNAEKITATEPFDRPRLSEKLAATGSATPTPRNKRKADDGISSPAKKPKLQSGNPQNSLVNYRQACFMNASLHVLHSIPAFAAMKNGGNEAIEADDVLSGSEMRSALVGGRTRAAEAARAKLRDHLRSRNRGNELKLSPHLNQMMMLLSTAREEPLSINPFTFQQVCGTMFSGSGASPMNGDTQEDAHEFITKLLFQLRKEQPELDIDRLLTAQFAEQQVCECGAAKTFVEENCNFNIPQCDQLRRQDLEDLLLAYLQDSSKYDNYHCERCGQSGKWSTKGGWQGKRMAKSPEYLIANVPRGHVQMKGHRMEQRKLTTRIIPPIKKVQFPSVDGSLVNYNLVAMTKHVGKNLRKGHYLTIRKIENQWYHCDDTNAGGVFSLTHKQVGNHEEGCIFLLKRTSGADFDGTALVDAE